MTGEERHYSNPYQPTFLRLPATLAASLAAMLVTPLRGEAVYAAFQDAAERGVQIRFLLSYGLNDTKQSFVPRQVTDLTSKYDNVNYRIWNAGDWYNGGIMHQKLWVVDGIHVYLGSSNMDWLSLAQVKEMGVLMWNSTKWGGEVRKCSTPLFWCVGAPNALS